MRTPIRRLTAVTVAISALALAACGGSDDAESGDDAVAESDADAGQAEDPSTDEPSTADDGGEDDVGSDDDAVGGDGSAGDGASGGVYNSGSAVVVFDDVTYEFAPTGDPYSCFIVEESGIVMASFDGVSAAGDVLYLDYDSDFSDEVSATVSTVDPVELWYFGTSIGGTGASPTELTVGDGEATVAGELISNVPDREPRDVTVTVRCD